jgi:hypothetical protein
MAIVAAPAIAATASMSTPLFSVHAPRFEPSFIGRAPMVMAREPGISADETRPSTVEELEARLKSLAGPENAARRRRVRNAIKKKLAQGDDPFAQAKAALPTVVLPPALSSQPLPHPPSPSAAPRRATRRQRSRSPPRGGEPNIGWRAITMDELRAHPSFLALPPAHLVLPTSPADLRLFRQDSWQWWECHAGRISTSACASCLGVYEERSASFLGVPPSLRGHGKALDAHSRLASPVLSEYLRLHTDSADADAAAQQLAKAEKAARGVWRPREDSAAADHSGADGSSLSPFLCEYRRRAAAGRSRAGGGGRASFGSVGQIRMAWGSQQEATSILAALNFFGAQNATVEEAGLQPLEAIDADERAGLPSGLPPIGASPDAIVRWHDGSVEPFEVKNHAPFATNFRARTDPSLPRFEVRDPGPYDEVAVWHVPQLYLHMLCMGAGCRSALFMSASATKGVHIFRLRRDESLMRLMLTFVAKFAAEHGRGKPPPPPDFWWGVDEYDALLEGLRRAGREDVELVARVPDNEVQRGRAAPFFFD